MSISETAKKFNLSERSVRNYCANGRIPGALLQGKTWLIPENASKPERSNGKDGGLDKEAIQDGFDLINFINNSPVAFYSIKNVRQVLLENGYKELQENKSFEVKKGDKVFFIRNGSTIIALNIGEQINKEECGYHIIASHADSPCFKIKPECESKTDIYNKINLEVYGGLIAPTWLDRPLSVAGRVLVNTPQGVTSRLLNIQEDIAMIPNLCIHFREDRENYNYNRAVDLQAFFAQELEDGSFKSLIAKQLDVDIEDIINFDLYLYNRDSGYLWGSKKEFVSSSRLDDLECVYTSLKGFVDGNNDSAINVLYVADNEEVGSRTRQGADSDFLETVLKGVSKKLGLNYKQALSNSFLVSADNAHAVHPNKPGISDANNRPYMNKGIAIKFNASQSYTSDAVSSAIFQKICDNSGTPYQFFTNRSDLRGGSTLGAILLSHVSVMSVDVGLPQLAMHSSFETAGTIDIKHAINAFKEFYSSKIVIDGNSFDIIK